MFSRRSFIKDRLAATAVFSGIAIAAVAGFELVIGGALPALSSPFERIDATPYERNDYLDTVYLPWESNGRVVPLGSAAQLPIETYESMPIDQAIMVEDGLAGGYGQGDLPADAAAPAPDEAALAREIAALFADTADLAVDEAEGASAPSGPGPVDDLTGGPDFPADADEIAPPAAQAKAPEELLPEL